LLGSSPPAAVNKSINYRFLGLNPPPPPPLMWNPAFPEIPSSIGEIDFMNSHSAGQELLRPFWNHDSSWFNSTVFEPSTVDNLKFKYLTVSMF
jgi:hypothetical protein